MIKLLIGWLNAACAHLGGAHAWQDIASAPSEQDIELAIMESEIRPLPFACARIGDDWINVQTGKRVDILPTHWRALPQLQRLSCCC